MANVTERLAGLHSSPWEGEGGFLPRKKPETEQTGESVLGIIPEVMVFLPDP